MQVLVWFGSVRFGSVVERQKPWGGCPRFRSRLLRILLLRLRLRRRYLCLLLLPPPTTAGRHGSSEIRRRSAPATSAITTKMHWFLPPARLSRCPCRNSLSPPPCSVSETASAVFLRPRMLHPPPPPPAFGCGGWFFNFAFVFFNQFFFFNVFQLC